MSMTFIPIYLLNRRGFIKIFLYYINEIPPFIILKIFKYETNCNYNHIKDLEMTIKNVKKVWFGENNT
jgi:hypothetical protein